MIRNIILLNVFFILNIGVHFAQIESKQTGVVLYAFQKSCLNNGDSWEFKLIILNETSEEIILPIEPFRAGILDFVQNDVSYIGPIIDRSQVGVTFWNKMTSEDSIKFVNNDCHLDVREYFFIKSCSFVEFDVIQKKSHYSILKPEKKYLACFRVEIESFYQKICPKIWIGNLESAKFHIH